MTLQIRFTTLTVAAAAVMLVLALVLWPPPSAPTEAPFWFVLLAIECLASALGVAFFAFVRPRTSLVSQRLTLAAYLAVGFLLVSWWPHVYLRELVPIAGSAKPLLRQAIYAFHDVFMVAAAISALFLARALSERKEEATVRGPWWKRVTWRFALVAVGVAVISLPAVSIVYAALRLPTAPPPAAWLLPGLLLNTALTRLALGVGIAFAIFGWHLVKKVTAARPLGLLTFVSITWCLVAWLPYQQIDYLISGRALEMGTPIPESGAAQLWLGYTFHVTLIAAAAMQAAFFARITALEVRGGLAPVSAS